MKTEETKRCAADRPAKALRAFFCIALLAVGLMFPQQVLHILKNPKML